MFSTVHGAGRVMSRTAAAGKVNRRNGKVVKAGVVSAEMMTSWVREKGWCCEAADSTKVRTPIGGCPTCSPRRRARSRVLHTLRPLIVVMAGADMFDPYKD